MAFLTIEDLAVFVQIDEAKAAAMIEDAEAQAVMVAPCLAEPEKLTAAQIAATKGILRRAILRWHESGASGNVRSVQETVGSFSNSTTWESQTSRGLYWPTEITGLQDICKQATGSTGAKAFGIDTAGHRGLGNHMPWCSITWGDWCSCGAYLTVERYPLWEGGLIS